MVDLPGTTDERVVIGDITKETAELASMFAVVFKMGHIGGPEKDVVKVVAANHKPFIVIINHCDTYEDEFERPDGEDLFRKDYASRLDIPQNIIHFVSAKAKTGMFSSSMDSLRGCLFGYIKELIGDKVLDSALAMRFIPPTVVDELKHSDIDTFSCPDSLGKAAASLMYNFQTITASSLQDVTQEVTVDDSIHRRSETGVNLFGKEMCLRHVDYMRQLSTSLRVTELAFSTFLQVFNMHYSRRYRDFTDTITSNYGHHGSSNIEQKQDWIIGEKILGELRASLDFYFNDPYRNTKNECSDDVAVLLGFQALLYHWTGEKACSEAEVQDAVVKSVEDNIDDLTESNISHHISGNAIHLLSKASSACSPKKNDSGKLSSVQSCKMRYRAYRARYEQLVHANLFQPVSDLCSSTCTVHDTEEELKVFADNLKNCAYAKTDDEVIITLSRVDTMIDELFSRFGSMSEDEMNAGAIQITLLSQLYSTQDIMHRVASKINANPSIAMLSKDDASGYLYFDPVVCHSSDTKVLRRVCKVYQALGRLIGYCLFNHLTIGLKFPLTIYRLLLGQRIGIDDLQLIQPKLAMSLLALDDEALAEYDIFYSEKSDGSYDGPSMDGTIAVVGHNRMEFISHVVRYFLVVKSKNNPVSHFCLGVQDLCPREVFHCVTPVVLQDHVEGARVMEAGCALGNIIFAPKFNICETQVINMFWDVVLNMEVYQCLRILAFIVGTSNLRTKLSQYKRDRVKLITVAVSSALSETDNPVAVPHRNTMLLPMYRTKAAMIEGLQRVLTNVNGIHPY